MFAVAAMFCAAAFAGYTAYDQATMTDAERMLMANLEALTSGDEGGGAYIKCYCALMSDANCAVNNNGSSVCAGGENIECWNYDRNCN